MIDDTQSAQISQKQDECNIYVIMKTMCRPGYDHNGFVATRALGCMMYGYTLLVTMNQRVLNKLSKELWDFFPRQLTQSYFDWLCYECNCIKCESRLFVKLNVDHMVYNTDSKGITVNCSSFERWIQLKVYSRPAKNIWITSLTLILMFWWIELVILRRPIKVYQNFHFNFEDIGRENLYFTRP